MKDKLIKTLKKKIEAIAKEEEITDNTTEKINASIK